MKELIPCGIFIISSIQILVGYLVLADAVAVDKEKVFYRKSS
jgi:hypothetical protein